jgi:hypothetical protein
LQVVNKLELTLYAWLLAEIKSRVRQAQTRAVLAANAELLRLYWDVGRLIDARQRKEGWGAGGIPRLAADLRNELPEVKGFSERNIKRMLAFCRAYSPSVEFVPQPVAQIAMWWMTR